MAENPTPPTAIDVVRLGLWQRAVAGVGGGGLVLAGVVATFKDHDGSPAIAMIATGGVLLVLALLGIFPSKVKVGEYEIEMFASRLLDKVPAETRDDVEMAIAQAAAETGVPVSPGLRARLRGAHFESEVAQALAEVVLPRTTPYEKGKHATGWVPDELFVRDGRYVAVDIKSTAHVNDDYLAAFADYLSRRTPAGKRTFGLLVLGGGLSPREQAVAERFGLAWCRWQSPEDNGRLKDAIEALLRG